MKILDEIVDYKKEELEHFRRRVPFEELKAQVKDAPGTLSFRGALLNPPEAYAIIAEIKRKSPSKGVLRKDFDPVVFAKDYASHGATALSVLTDEHFFGGHLDHLAQVRQAVTVPLLRKDFVWDSYQIYAARVAGADAVLLIAAILGQNQMEDLQGQAEELGLSVLVEVHDEAECQQAASIGAKMVGVNNRDLKNFKVQVETSEKLFPLLGHAEVLVSESGIDSPETLKRLKKAGAHAFLIGEHFMKSEKPGEALANLIKGG